MSTLRPSAPSSSRSPTALSSRAGTADENQDALGDDASPPRATGDDTAEVTPGGAWVLASVLLGTFTVSLNNSALNLAVAELMVTFEASASQVNWVITLFMISMAMSMPLTGYLADRFGRRTIYLLGLSGFLAGSLLGAMADSLSGIIMARALQGTAAGLMIPLSLALIFAAYPPEQRGRISGIWGFAVMIAPAIGPTVGGLLLELTHWRALFLMNLPFALLGLALGWRCLRREAPNRQRRFDLPGFVLITLGMGAVLAALGRVETLEDLLSIGVAVAVPLTAGIACLVAFVLVEQRTTAPLLALSLFRHSAYRLSVVLACLQSIILFGCVLLTPLWMQQVLGASPFVTGLVFLATALTASLCSPQAGRMIDRYPPQWCLLVGLGVTAISLMGLALMSPAAPVWLVGAWMGLRGIGLACGYLPATTVGVRALPDAEMTQASAMNNMARRLVASLGLVALSLYYDARVDQLAGSDASVGASAQALSEAFTALALIALLCLPLAWRLGRATRHHTAHMLT
ncbi:DHA2 family efflux MFS transporter permease subunit [Halomonas sp. DP8Y7-3]|uniref:DHA2 family efflux MFS transporter permease subunit n=1 Tax=Halomonas sp. DP8Y7-3 TaxID=2859079 RepID=UPI001C95A8C2|nr:DHA2 family efflux MFS transporter permease subunit [Halomonas sp. DP8Y7-3]MBY5928186.1 DHA2 family efflux MFS transporter permease subunit [Halomonas sp. DP8Y7-3]